jgi:cyclase
VAREKLQAHVRRAINSGAGEVLLQSVDRDGTGKGLDVSLAKQAKSGTTPLILMGGVGQARHISEGLQSDAVDAVATANLFNFVGNALIDSRALAQMDGAQLATWLSERLESLRGVLRDADRPDTEVGAEVPHHC